MNVSDAIDSRMSCRAFQDTPVPEAVVRNILDIARRAPSGGNVQPWHVYVIAGEKLREFRAIIAEKMRAGTENEGLEYDIYPSSMPEPYRSRRFKCGEDMYATLSISRDDKAARRRQFIRNYQFFDAPVALFFAINRRMGPPQWSDLGMFLQSIMLLAREEGLHTCAQEAWARWHKTVGEFLSMPEELMLFCGMGLGFRDETAPVNRLRTDRAPLEEIVTFQGFEIRSSKER